MIPVMSVRLKAWPDLSEPRPVCRALSVHTSWPSDTGPRPEDMKWVETRRPTLEVDETLEGWWDVRRLEEISEPQWGDTPLEGDDPTMYLIQPDGNGFHRMLCIVPDGGNGFDSDLVTIFSDEISAIRFYDRDTNEIIWEKTL